MLVQASFKLFDLEGQPDVVQMVPSCLYMVMKSKLFQASTNLPFSIREKAMPVNSISMPVAAKPRLSPVCLPRTEQRQATLSVMAIESSTTTTRSGRAGYCLPVVGETVHKTTFCHQLVDGLGPAFVPDLLEPAPNKSVVILRHDDHLLWSAPTSLLCRASTR